jgi:hypothetical protein
MLAAADCSSWCFTATNSRDWSIRLLGVCYIISKWELLAPACFIEADGRPRNNRALVRLCRFEIEYNRRLSEAVIIVDMSPTIAFDGLISYCQVVALARAPIPRSGKSRTKDEQKIRLV